jgi:hypothetical protein
MSSFPAPGLLRSVPPFLLIRALFAVGVLFPVDATAEGEIAPPSLAELRATVRLTEVCRLRTLLVLDSYALPHEGLIAGRLTDIDFRVFPHARPAPSRLDPGVIEKDARAAGIAPEELQKIGAETPADLVFFVTVASREKTRLGDFQLHEATATAQLFSPRTGEMLVSCTARRDGARDLDAVAARRSAIEGAVDVATREAVVGVLEKAGRLVVHQAVITDVADHGHLLAIIEHMLRLPGIHHVRQISHDTTIRQTVLEIIGSPRTDVVWRAHLEKLPRVRAVDLASLPDENLRRHYPSWWSTGAPADTAGERAPRSAP